MNPYLHPVGSGGGWWPAPNSYFGASVGSGVYSPAPGAYFGAQNGDAALAACAPRMDQNRLAQLTNMLRHPLGQWPGMPPLNPAALQEAASCVACNAQVQADALRTIYGVDSGAGLIPAGATATITVTPQKRHIPERLVLSTAMAAAFIINAIDAGVESVLATTGPISAAIFVQDSTAGNFKSVIMDVGMTFSVQITNISGAAARFTATVLGKPVPPGLI